MSDFKVHERHRRFPLPDRFKDSVKSEARVARRATEEDKLTEPPKEKLLTTHRILEMRKHHGAIRKWIKALWGLS